MRRCGAFILFLSYLYFICYKFQFIIFNNCKMKTKKKLTEDIYVKSKEEKEIDPEDVSKYKTPNDIIETRNEKDFESDKSGSDLDVPGSELDDAQENIGSEDEENNYYSLGGDNHNDLEENNGE